MSWEAKASSSQNNKPPIIGQNTVATADLGADIIKFQTAVVTITNNTDVPINPVVYTTAGYDLSLAPIAASYLNMAFNCYIRIDGGGPLLYQTNGDARKVSTSRVWGFNFPRFISFKSLCNLYGITPDLVMPGVPRTLQYEVHLLVTDVSIPATSAFINGIGATLRNSINVWY
jgi:hypothetical protein